MEHNARRLPDRDTQGKQRDHHQQAESDMPAKSLDSRAYIDERPRRNPLASSARAGANADRIQDAKRLNCGP